MPYKTGVLLESESSVFDEPFTAICSILSEFFDEKITLSPTHTGGWNFIAVNSPLNMPLYIGYGIDSNNWAVNLFKGSCSFWKCNTSSYGSSENWDFPLMYHVATNKNNTIMSLGVGFSSVGEPFFTVTIIKAGDSYIAIQHGVTDIRSGSDTRWAKDAYHKSETNYKMMSAKASGGYYSDSKLVLVPAIDPWTGDVIPDLYMSILRPIDTRSVRNLISINGRQFISGVVNDGGGDAYIQAMPMFIEI